MKTACCGLPEVLRLTGIKPSALYVQMAREGTFRVLSRSGSVRPQAVSQGSTELDSAACDGLCSRWSNVELLTMAGWYLGLPKLDRSWPVSIHIFSRGSLW